MKMNFGQMTSSPSSQFCILVLFVVLLPCDSIVTFDPSEWFINNPGLEAECEGSCRYSMGCWMSGGVTSSTCGGFFQYCCERPAESEARRYWTNFIFQDSSKNEGRGFSSSSSSSMNELSNEPQELHFGPVINDPICGKPVTARRRVVGGSEAGFGNFPWQALIRVGSSRCGGALVSTQYVVTAGHCVHTASPYSVRVYLGEYSLYRNIEPLPRQKYVVTSIDLHPYYRFTPQADRYDIAVLRLDRSVRYQPHISPVCLPLRGQVFPEGTRAMVAGWGALAPDSPQRPRELQAVDVETIESTKCEKWHRKKGIKVEIFSDMVCAGHEHGGKDACQGDSGGPLMTKGLDGRWTLIGLVSAGYSCAKPGQPGIYHRVAKTADWISYHILYGH